MGRMFEKRKTTIFARAARVSKQFSRISKEIMMVVKSGGASEEANPALRRAVQNARAACMPKEKIENAIRSASGEGGASFEEVYYEGYAPHGIAILVETATDNPTRTVANIRSAFKGAGGNLGNVGSVSFLFQRMGVFRIPTEGIDADELELELIDHGLEEMLEGESDDGDPQFVIRCGFTDLGNLQRALKERNITPVSTGTEYICLNPVPLSEDDERDVLAMVDKLEQDDDVQRVFHSLA